MAAFCKDSGCVVIVSAILMRGDKLIEKGQTVNRKTENLCLAKNICFLEHRNFNAKYHLNRNKLHHMYEQHEYGSGILAFDFLKNFTNV